MKTYLFSLGLIPVQEWIAQARRSRDLRAGSVLLAHMMAGVLGRIEIEVEGRIVLPLAPRGSARKPDGDALSSGGRRSFAELGARSFAEALEDDYGIPNRATGYLTAASDETAAAFLGSLEGEVVERWRGWRDGFLCASRNPQADEAGFWKDLELYLGAYRSLVDESGDCPLSLVWVAKKVEQPAGEEEEDVLRADLEAIDELYGDVKRSRPIRPWPAGAPIGKCNQCGRREAFGPTEDFDRWREWYGKLEGRRWLREGFRIDAGERLCYVCLARRIAGYAKAAPGKRKAFRSTGEVALHTWCQRLQADAPLGRLLADLQASLPPAEDLGSAIFRSRRPRTEPQLPPEVVAKVADLEKAIKDWNDARHRRGATDPRPGEPPRPIPPVPSGYLAMLTFDGDGMGALVRRHPRTVTARMEEFAARAWKILKEAGAEIFYLAGDEGLVMLPAAPAIRVARALRDAFDEVFAEVAGSPTLSAGLAFFEQSSPIHRAQDGARSALHSAKQIEGKNALGVGVETASGTRWRLAERWGPTWRRIDAAAGAVRNRQLAAAWAYDVERFVAGLDPESWDRLVDEPKLLRAEVKRLLGRRLLRTKGEPDSPTRRERLEKTWKDLEGDKWWSAESGRPKPHPEQFHLIGFLARQDDGGGAASERSS